MAQFGQNAAAQVEPDAGGFPLFTAVVAGEPLFKDPGQILCPDADAVVGDDQSFLFCVDVDGALFRRVLQGVGQKLTDGKGEPLLIGKYGAVGLVKGQY